MRKTVWLLDVDGVINADRAGWGRAPVRRNVTDRRGDSYRMRWAPELVTFIREVIDSEAAEVVWCTTWCDDAHLLEDLWGLPPLRRAFDVPAGKFVGQVKLDAVRAELAAGHRVIWTDDTEVPDVSEGATQHDVNLHIELMMSRRALLIRPDGRYGLRLDDAVAIRDFIGAS